MLNPFRASVGESWLVSRDVLAHQYEFQRDPNSVHLECRCLSALSGRGLSVQSRAPLWIYAESALARPTACHDAKFHEMCSGESEHTAAALLLHEHEQAHGGVVISERRRLPVDITPPESKERARLARSGPGRPNMPCLIADLRDSRLVVAVLQFRSHHNGYPYLGRIALERPEPHTATLSRTEPDR